MIALALGLFLLNVVGDYMVGRYYDARVARRPLPAATWSAAIALLGTLDIVGFLAIGPAAVAVIPLGCFVGTLVSFRR